MKKLVLIDNLEIYNRVIDFLNSKRHENIDIRHSGKQLNCKTHNFFSNQKHSINIKENIEAILEKYDLIFSIHCRQIFPKQIIDNIRCVNLHPGFNPDTRGWFPHIHAIIKGLPAGATLHEIDEYIDHGPIIARKQVNIELWDTSYSLYNKILDAECELLKENFDTVIANNYQSKFQNKVGELFKKSDYEKLLEIDLKEEGKFIEFYNKLRALSHKGYKNAYIKDEHGNKIYLELKTERE